MQKNKQQNPSPETGSRRHRPLYKHPLFLAAVILIVIAGIVFAVLHFTKKPSNSSDSTVSTSQSSNAPKSTQSSTETKNESTPETPPTPLLLTPPSLPTAKLRKNTRVPTRIKEKPSLALSLPLASTATNSSSASISTNTSPPALANSLSRTALTNWKKPPASSPPLRLRLVRASTSTAPNSLTSLVQSTSTLI